MVDDDYVIDVIQQLGDKEPETAVQGRAQEAVADAYTRLIAYFHTGGNIHEGCREAEQEAISVFSKNLKNLLLAPPAGSKITIGVDPVTARAASSRLLTRKAISRSSDHISDAS